MEADAVRIQSCNNCQSTYSIGAAASGPTDAPVTDVPGLCPICGSPAIVNKGEGTVPRSARSY